jgi:non-specific serine/threonine protein kinase
MMGPKARVPGSDQSALVSGCTLALTPHGRLRLHGSGAAESDLDAPTLERIRDAFARGHGYGLFHLGAVEATSALPPVPAFWRDFGRVFMAALCSVPDLAEQPDELRLPVSQGSLSVLVEAAPPMLGGEYLSTEVLEALWADMEAACRTQLQTFEGNVQEFLREKNPVWNLVGRVHFHLAEQKHDAAVPFAFMATYTTRLGRGNKVQHQPLGKALQQYAGARNKQALLALLRPVHQACERSPFLRELVDSGSVFHPLGWTPAEAYRFLKDIPAFESGGIVVRVPDWWKAGRPSRPQVQVQVGGRPAAGLGLDALLDFSVEVALDGERLTKRELREILAATQGLALIRGRWVEIDSTRLEQVLEHWRAVESAAGDGLSFIDGMRLLSGADLGPGDDGLSEESIEEWSSRTAGGWLAKVLEDLQRPEPEKLGLDEELRATLRPYQKIGVSWLWRLGQLGLGACLADDMGLGKTIQVLALLLLRRKQAASGTSLLIVPASLIGNWRAEIERFTPGLRSLIAHPSALASKELRRLAPEEVSQHDLVITSYGFVSRLPWAASFEWDLLVLDEAQAIKNPSARQTRAVKALRSRNRVVLTGTPVENRLSDLWSIFDFVNPGLLGTARTFKSFAKRLDEREQERYAPLRRLIRPYILRRLKTDRNILPDLPDKTEVNAYCSLTRTQAALYQESVKDLSKRLRRVDGIQRRGVVLAFLTRFKQICNHPSQWLGDGAYRPEDSGKFARLRELCESLASRQEKVLVFSQYREMAAPLSSFLGQVFGRSGVVLHGQVPVKKRMKLVERFQEDEDVPFFVLSLKAGGTGLNLTAASQVIHFDRWWNPAVESQATDRAFRIGQEKNVLVHKFVCRGTVEEKIAALLEGKQRMSTELLEGGADALLTEMDDGKLLELVSLDIHSALQEV